VVNRTSTTIDSLKRECEESAVRSSAAIDSIRLHNKTLLEDTTTLVVQLREELNLVSERKDVEIGARETPLIFLLMVM
jgi:hypothetical protein